MSIHPTSTDSHVSSRDLTAGSTLKKTLVFVFPGTNCDTETFSWIANNLETDVEYFDSQKHQHLTADNLDALILPGGFSFGDYLRAGAIAARSDALDFVKARALENVPILGICNGFQILCESGLLPGALTKNITQQHHHFPVELKMHKSFFDLHNKNYCVWIPKFDNPQTLRKIIDRFQHISLPMSCGSGRYIPVGTVSCCLSYQRNENGSTDAIAGITNTTGNILGLMPHPERASSRFVGSTRGLIFLLGLAMNRKIKIKEKSELAQFDALELQ